MSQDFKLTVLSDEIHLCQGNVNTILSMVHSRGLRIRHYRGNAWNETQSFAVPESLRRGAAEAFVHREEAGRHVFVSDSVTIALRIEDGTLTIEDGNGNVALAYRNGGVTLGKNRAGCRWEMESSDRFYGLGEKMGQLNKAGRKYTMWNTDDPFHVPNKDPLYKSIPFLIKANGSRFTGLFVDRPSKLRFDLGADAQDAFSVEAEDDRLDYYVWTGNDLKAIIARYAQLTGTMSLPPMWSIGYQQSRYSYYPEAKVAEIASTMREKGIPCDVLYLDIDYMDGYRVFTFDEERFPDPGRLIGSLREQGYRVVTSMDPGVKKDPLYDVYRDGVAKDLFCRTVNGDIYEGEVWPGTVAFPDFTKPETRSWWAGRHSALFDAGVRGIWNDMNEPTDFKFHLADRTQHTVPGDVLLDGEGHPDSFDRYHNAYGQCMCQATIEGFETLLPNERPFILSRAAYAGIQKYAAVWTGDNHSWWEHLEMSVPMLLGLGMSGVPFVGADIGGFQENATPELFVRWMQLGAFTPLCRAHTITGSKPHEPWAFGAEAEEICRQYIRLRYSLLYYWYSAFRDSAESGLPIMRPLIMEDAVDPMLYDLNDQFMIGDSLMAALVCRPSVTYRSVYFPQGVWYDFFTGRKYEGGAHYSVDAPLERMPLYVKGGSIVPMIPVMQHAAERPITQLTLEIYPDRNNVYRLYEDDGLTRGYENGEFRRTDFALETEEDGFTFAIRPVVAGYSVSRTEYVLNFHGAGEGCVVECEDSHSIAHDRDRRILTVNLIHSDKPQQLKVSR